MTTTEEHGNISILVHSKRFYVGSSIFCYRIVYLDANFWFYRTCTVKDSVLGIADPDIQLTELTALTSFGHKEA